MGASSGRILLRGRCHSFEPQTSRHIHSPQLGDSCISCSAAVFSGALSSAVPRSDRTGPQICSGILHAQFFGVWTVDQGETTSWWLRVFGDPLALVRRPAVLGAFSTVGDISCGCLDSKLSSECNKGEWDQSLLGRSKSLLSAHADGLVF